MGVTILITVLWITYKLGKYALNQGMMIENNKLQKNMAEWEKKNKKTS